MISESPSGKLLWTFFLRKMTVESRFHLSSDAGIHRCHPSSGDVLAQIRADYSGCLQGLFELLTANPSGCGLQACSIKRLVVYLDKHINKIRGLFNRFLYRALIFQIAINIFVIFFLTASRWISEGFVSFTMLHLNATHHLSSRPLKSTGVFST